MARISSEEAVKQIGNRYDMVLIASKRVRELSNGHAPLVKSSNGPILTALKEIEEGKINREILHKSPPTKRNKHDFFKK